MRLAELKLSRHGTGCKAFGGAHLRHLLSLGPDPFSRSDETLLLCYMYVYVVSKYKARRCKTFLLLPLRATDKRNIHYFGKAIAFVYIPFSKLAMLLLVRLVFDLLNAFQISCQNNRAPNSKKPKKNSQLCIKYNEPPMSPD
jgi:hypothetical protein